MVLERPNSVCTVSEINPGHEVCKLFKGPWMAFAHTGAGSIVTSRPELGAWRLLSQHDHPGGHRAARDLGWVIMPYSTRLIQHCRLTDGVLHEQSCAQDPCFTRPDLRRPIRAWWSRGRQRQRIPGPHSLHQPIWFYWSQTLHPLLQIYDVVNDPYVIQAQRYVFPSGLYGGPGVLLFLSLCREC